MKKLKLMYVFSSGVFNSPNIKQWLDIFYNHPSMDISILISDCSSSIKSQFISKYGESYKCILFGRQENINELSIRKRFQQIRKTTKMIDRIAPDIIHVHGLYYSDLVASVLRTRSKPKLIFNVWGNDYNTSYFTSFKRKLLMNHLFKKADLIWTNWFEMADKLKSRFPQYVHKIKTYMWGVEDSVFAPPSEKVKNEIKNLYNIQNKEFVMLYAKGIRPSNNHHLLLKALSHLSRYSFKLILHCTGQQPTQREELIKLISDYNLKEKVVFTDHYLSDEEMQALFELSNLSFAISEKDQLTRTIFETILADTHLILNDIDSYQYLKNIYGFDLDLVDVNDEQKFAKRIEQYLIQQHVPNWEYEKQVIQRVMKFSQKRDQFYDIYQSVKNSK